MMIKYYILGDIHGCYTEFKEFLRKIDWLIDEKLIPNKNSHLIILGDYVDKSDDEDMIKTIELIYQLIQFPNFTMIKGNHEYVNMEWIENKNNLILEKDKVQKREKYYNTSLLLEKNLILQKKFIEIFKKSVYFFSHENFVTTHAPCENKYLEKTDPESLYKQMKCISRSQNLNKPLTQLLSYLYMEANNNDKLHIFGHISQPYPFIYKNKICLDTGCVYGNSLTWLEYFNHKYQIFSIKAQFARKKYGFNNNINSKFNTLTIS